MKKLHLIIFFVALSMIGRSQDGYQVIIKFLPEEIEILPGVYEVLGKIDSTGGTDKNKDCYALSVNQGLVTQLRDALQAGRHQVLYGPKLEKLVQEKILADYQRVRFGLEQSIKEELVEADSADQKKLLHEKLRAEQKNTKTYIARLKKIASRTEVRAIYVYGIADETTLKKAAETPKVPEGSLPDTAPKSVPKKNQGEAY